MDLPIFRIKTYIADLTKTKPFVSFSTSKYNVRQRREEETLQTNFFGTANFCAGKNLRTDQIPGRAGKSTPRLLTWNDRESGQGMYDSDLEFNITAKLNNARELDLGDLLRNSAMRMKELKVTILK